MFKKIKGKKGITGIDVIMSIAILIIGITMTSMLVSSIVNTVRAVQEEEKINLGIESRTKELYQIFEMILTGATVSMPGVEKDVSRTTEREIVYKYRNMPGVEKDVILKVIYFNTDNKIPKMQIYTKRNEKQRDVEILEKVIKTGQSRGIEINTNQTEAEINRTFNRITSGTNIFPLKSVIQNGVLDFVPKRENQLERDRLFGDDLRVYFGIEENYISKNGDNYTVQNQHKGRVKIFLKKVAYKRADNNSAQKVKEVRLNELLDLVHSGYHTVSSTDRQRYRNTGGDSYFIDSNGNIRTPRGTYNAYEGGGGYQVGYTSSRNKGDWVMIESIYQGYSKYRHPAFVIELTKQYVASLDPEVATESKMNSSALARNIGPKLYTYFNKY